MVEGECDEVRDSSLWRFHTRGLFGMEATTYFILLRVDLEAWSSQAEIENEFLAEIVTLK